MLSAVLLSLVLAGAECPAPDLQEQLLIDKIKEFPDYLIKNLTGNDLQRFLANLAARGMMIGMPDVDRIYLIKSDTHPDDYIIYWIKDGCIVVDGYTPKDLIDGMVP